MLRGKQPEGMSCLNCRESLRRQGHVHCVDCGEIGNFAASVDLCFVCFADRAEVAGGLHQAAHRYMVVPASALDGESEISGWTDGQLLTLLDASRISGVGNFWAAARAVDKAPQDCDDCFARLFSDFPFSDRHPLKGCRLQLPSAPAAGKESEISVISGFLPKRGDFDVEFDDGAELAVADLEISAEDAPAEVELKLEVLRCYSERLAERRRAKQLAIDHILARESKYPLSIYEQEISDRVAPAARFFRSAREARTFAELCAAERRLLERLGESEISAPEFRPSKKNAALLDKARKLHDALSRPDTKDKLRLSLGPNPPGESEIAPDILALLKPVAASAAVLAPGEAKAPRLYQVLLAE